MVFIAGSSEALSTFCYFALRAEVPVVLYALQGLSSSSWSTVTLVSGQQREVCSNLFLQKGPRATVMIFFPEDNFQETREKYAHGLVAHNLHSLV